MDPIADSTKPPPTPGEINARRWLLLMGVVAVVLTVATGVWYLSSRREPSVLTIDPPVNTSSTTVPPVSAYDASATGPPMRLTVESGVATGTIVVTANDIAAIGDVRVAVDLSVDGGRAGVRVTLDTSLVDAQPIDRFVFGSERIRLNGPGWRLRCIDVAPCTQRIDFRLELPNDAPVVDVAWRVGALLNHPTGALPEGAAVSIDIPAAEVVATPFLPTSVGAALDAETPSLAVVRMTMPAGFDDSTLEVLAFARASATTLRVLDPTSGEQPDRTTAGVLPIAAPTRCPADGPDCVFDLWVVAEVEPSPEAVGGSFWVEARSERLPPPFLELHDADPVVVSGDAPGGAKLTVTLDAGGGPDSLRAVLVTRGLEPRKPIVTRLCDPDCRVPVLLQTLPFVPGTTPPGVEAPEDSQDWTIVGFLVAVGDVAPSGNPTLEITVE